MARQTARYESAVAELAEHADLLAFQGPAGLYAWNRLEALVQRLRDLYDDYELEGDVAPVRREVEDYLHDLSDHQLRPDPGVSACLLRFVNELTPDAITIETRQATPAPGWPNGLLAISPAELQALHEALQERTHPQTY
jgi:hypothetical protein